MDKKCPNCGNTANSSAVFCTSCGTRFTPATSFFKPAQSLSEPAAPVAEPSAAPVAAPPVAPVAAPPAAPVAAPPVAPVAAPPAPPAAAPMPPTPKKSKKALWIILAVLGVIIAVAAVLFSLSSSENDEDDREEDETEQAGDDTDEDGTDDDIQDDDEKDDGEKESDPANKTVMVYIVGSDLESDGGAASIDIEEMLESGVDTEKNHILVYTGGSADWDNSQISEDENTIWLIEGDELTEVDSQNAKNMGKSSTLAEFIEFGMDNYPNDQYVLILWDHGGGPMGGYGVDTLHGNDCLELTEIADALDEAGLGGKNKLELIGFDACLMGTIETAWCMKDYANYFVASQELEPGFGWNYAFLKDVESYSDGEALGKVIIDSYFEGAEEYSSYRQMDMTLSCLDLSQIEDAEESLDALFSEVNDAILDDAFAEVSRCRYKTKSFAKSGSSFSYDLVDLTHLTSLLEDDYSDEAEALQEDLEELICYSKSNTSHAEGVSIYHPYDNTAYMDAFLNYYENFDFAEKYTDYISDFGDILVSGSSKETTFFNKNAMTTQQVGTGNELKMQLTEEQAAAYSGAQYIIFKKMSPDETFSKEAEYYPVFVGQDAVLDENNVLSATYEGKALFGIDSKTGEVSDTPLSLWQIHDGSGELKYYFACIFTNWTDGFIMDVVDWYLEIEDGQVQLLQAVLTPDGEAEENLIADKNYINPEDYDSYQILNNSYFITSDENGNIKLESTGSIYGWEYTKEDGFTIEVRDLEDKSDYYVVFSVTDIYGNKYTSEMFELE